MAGTLVNPVTLSRSISSSALRLSHLYIITTFCAVCSGRISPLRRPVAWNSGTVSIGVSRVAPPRNSRCPSSCASRKPRKYMFISDCVIAM